MITSIFAHIQINQLMKSFFLLIPILYLCGNGYLYWKVLQALTGSPLWMKIIISSLFWIVAFSLFITIGLRATNAPTELLRLLFNTGAVWLAFLLYMILLLALFGIAKLFINIPGNTLLYSFVATCCLLIFGYINYKNPEIKHLDLTIEKTFEKESIKIVSMSDIHLGYGTGISALKDYVALINSQQPDIILISGDLIDNSIKPVEKEPFDRILSELKAPMGIYMCPGNHEYISNIEACEKFLKRTPIHLLRDTVITLPEGINIIGRDDKSNRTRKTLAELMAKTNPELPVILLDHQPYNLNEADSLNVDLQLSGHTHHGQLFPFNVLTDYLYEQSHGYKKYRHTHVLVSSGLSLWGPPFRIGTKSDLAVIEIHSAK